FPAARSPTSWPSWAPSIPSSARSTGEHAEPAPISLSPPSVRAGLAGRAEPVSIFLSPPSVRAGLAAPATVMSLAASAVTAFILLNAVIAMVAYVTLLERKFAARMQSRIGPYYVGRPHGWLQPIADALKLMMKEDIVPTTSDRAVYNLAPIVFLVPCLLIFATIPFAPALGVADLNIGVLFFLAVSSL